MYTLLTLLAALFAALAIMGFILADYIERAMEELATLRHVQIAAVTARDAISLFRYGASACAILAVIVLSVCFWP
jgi:fatty acid desaturase